MMHKCPQRETHEPCNAYCHGDIHVDMLYAPVERFYGMQHATIVQQAQQDHYLCDRCKVCEFLAIDYAAEAPTLAQRYPLFASYTNSHSVALRLTYRIPAP